MYRIRRFGVIRTATVAAVMYAIGFAILFVPIALLGLAVQPGGRALAGVIVLGLLLIVVYPLVIWIATALACLLYNLTARWVGGIEVDVERKLPSSPAYSPWQQQPATWGANQSGQGANPGGWGATQSGWGANPSGSGSNQSGWGSGPAGWTPPPGYGQTPISPYPEQPYRPQTPSEQPSTGQAPPETDAPRSTRPQD